MEKKKKGVKIKIKITKKKVKFGAKLGLFEIKGVGRDSDRQRR